MTHTEQPAYSISTDLLDAALTLVQARQPEVTRQQLEAHCVYDWPEGEEHQLWLDEATPNEVSEWALSCHMNGEPWD